MSLQWVKNNFSLYPKSKTGWISELIPLVLMLSYAIIHNHEVPPIHWQDIVVLGSVFYLGISLSRTWKVWKGIKID